MVAAGGANKVSQRAELASISLGGRPAPLPTRWYCRPAFARLTKLVGFEILTLFGFSSAATFAGGARGRIAREEARMATMTRVEEKPATRPTARMRREDLKPGEVLCSYCTAKCCRYFALPIETPTDHQDFEYVRWYLLHERATVFVEDGNWYLLVHTRCRELRDDNLCGIYETRPQICRDYTTKNCEYDEDWVYDHYIETPEQVVEYAEAVLGPRKGRDIRSPKPDPLKVLS